MLNTPIRRIRNLWMRTRQVARAVTRDWRLLGQMDAVWLGYTRHEQWRQSPDPHRTIRKPHDERLNPLRAFFDAHTQGRGIWKWTHYFEIYNRHFSRFRDHEVHILEIGIYSGGSLEMWKNYFGPRCHIYAVDIEPACKTYGDDSVKVFIGDQADRAFWDRFRSEVPILDIVIDDGGHLPEQQIVSLEELLPHLQCGGVYVCEDVTGAFNKFASYVEGLAHKLNAYEQFVQNYHNGERRITCQTTMFQSAVGSIHLYPFVTVIERTDVPTPELVAPKHGTQWESFLQ